METTKINVSMLGLKARTKNEMYRLLTTEFDLYLPPQKETSIYFVKDLIHKKESNHW